MEVREVIEIESMLHESVRRVGCAWVNLEDQRVSGLPSSTPGSGSPGGGKGGSSRSIRVGDDRVPVTSVEAMVLVGGGDPAGRDLARLVEAAAGLVGVSSAVVEELFGQLPVEPLAGGDRRGVVAQVVHGYRCARLVRAEGDSSPSRGWGQWYWASRTVWQLVDRWAFTAASPRRELDPELLAIDLTGMWCRSCLRVGHRVPRESGRVTELCRWCRLFLAAEGFMPPWPLVEARRSGQRITEGMVVPHRAAHRDRVARTSRRA